MIIVCLDSLNTSTRMIFEMIWKNLPENPAIPKQTDNICFLKSLHDTISPCRSITNVEEFQFEEHL